MDKYEKAPLTEAAYYILLSVHTPLHGYGIIQNVQALSNGRLILAPGTLYGAITNLLAKGWITALAENPAERKKEYVISPLGKLIFQNELARLEELVENGKKYLIQE